MLLFKIICMYSVEAGCIMCDNIKPVLNMDTEVSATSSLSKIIRH
jgi:hypothetical protein